MSLVWGVTILGFMGSVVGPLIISAAFRRALERARLLEHQRQDELARRLAQKQDEIATTAEQLANRLTGAIDDVAAQLRADAVILAGRLEQILGAVNSTLTDALKAQLTSLEAQLVLMRRVVRLEAEGTQRPSADLVVGIEATEEEIRQLRARLTNRAESTQAGMDMRAALTAPTRDRRTKS